MLHLPRGKFAVLIVFALIAALLAFLPLMPQLRVYSAGDGRTVICRPVHPADSFTVTYTHSVNKSPVTDYFVITGTYEIMVTKTRFFSYGAGIPEPEPGQKIRTKDGYIEISNIDRILPSYRLFIGLFADHRLTFAGEPTLHLAELAQPQTTLVFEIRRASVLSAMLSPLLN